jgi:prephenate dehydratase
MPHITVAIQGERGSFSEEAARKLLGRNVRVRTHESFVAIFESVSKGQCRYCLAPIENTLAGSVYENYDLLLEHNLHIVAEVNLRIVHNLIAFSGQTLRRIRKVYSHPVALAQCSKFFKRNPGVEKVPFYDTAGSVKMLAEKPIPGAAAIASQIAARIYKGQILATHLEDDPNNFTRFLLLSRSPAAAGNKVSIVFSTAHEPGSLFKCLAVFALRDIDLTKLESRPLRGRPWEYFFYVDFTGNIKEAKCRKALDHLNEVTSYLRVLGCYKGGERVVRNGLQYLDRPHPVRHSHREM